MLPPNKLLFEENLTRINSVIERILSKRNLNPDEAEEIRSTVYEKLLENNCRILRNYDGKEISISYFMVVINNLIKDYYRSKYGRWRSSTKAKTLGEIAIVLEELLFNRNLSLESAFEEISTRCENRGETPPTRENLTSLATQFKPRQRPVTFTPGDEVLKNLAVNSQTAEEQLIAEELSQKKKELDLILESFHTQLSDEVQLVLKLYFESNQKISAIARGLGKPRHQVDKLINNTLTKFRRFIEQQGFTQGEILEVIEGLDRLNIDD
jgi:RNA polymerase sigma factor (sigma-70 family)